MRLAKLLDPAQWSAIAAIGSAVTAGLALWITISDRDTPYRQALYQERWHSYDDFARASTAFDVALADSSAAISNKVDTAEGLDKMSQVDLINASKPAADVLRAKRRYSEALAGILGPWPKSVVNAALIADRAGNDAMECQVLLGVHGEDLALRTDWWNYVRDQAKVHCKGFHNSLAVNKFDATTKIVLATMRDAIQKDNDDLLPGLAKKP